MAGDEQFFRDVRWRDGVAVGTVVAVGLAAAWIVGTAAWASRPPLATPGITVPLPIASRNPGDARAAEAAVGETQTFVRFTGPVGADLSEALRAARVPEAVARDYVRQILGVPDIANELSVADRFDLVAAGAPEAPALIYAGIDRVGRSDVQLFKWSDSHGGVRWLDAAGLGAVSGAMGLPLAGRITSRFGGRVHPILGHARFHRGIDLAARWGTPVAAAADGRVARAGWHGGYGQQVALVHGDGIETSYAHLSRIAASPGALIRRGQILGYVGSSGLSTGPHLHFEVSRNGRAIDPARASLSAPFALQGEQLHLFRDQLRFALGTRGG